MKNFNISPLKSIVIAVSISALSMAGSAQAHSDFDFSVPAQLLLFNALLQPHYDHGHDNHYKRKSRHQVKHYRHGRHGHDRHDRGHYKPRKHSHSHGGYSGKRLIKKRHNH